MEMLNMMEIGSMVILKDMGDLIGKMVIIIQDNGKNV